MIRKAVTADIPTLIENGERWHAESHWPDHASYVAEDFGASLAAAIASDDAFVLVSEADVLTGVICVQSIPLYFNLTHRIALETFWFSDDPKTGLKLLREAEKRAEECGSWPFFLGTQGPADVAAKVYGRLGYSPFGANFVKGR